MGLKSIGIGSTLLMTERIGDRIGSVMSTNIFVQRSRPTGITHDKRARAIIARMRSVKRRFIKSYITFMLS